MKLDKGQLAELKEFYDGSTTVLYYFAKLYGVSKSCTFYAVNHNNFRGYITKKRHEWIGKNPQKNKELFKRYYERNKVFYSMYGHLLYLARNDLKKT